MLKNKKFPLALLYLGIFNFNSLSPTLFIPNIKRWNHWFDLVVLVTLFDARENGERWEFEDMGI